MKHIELLFAASITMLLMNGLVFAQDTTLTVTSDGDVGIGTTSPGIPYSGGPVLHLQSTDRPWLNIETSSAGQWSSIRLKTPGAEWHLNAFSTNGRFELWNPTSGYTLVATNAGNVGIGTTSPNTLAHIGPASSRFGGLSDVQLLTVRSGHNMVLAESVGSATDAGILLATGTNSKDAAIFLDDSDGQKLKFATGNVDFDAGRNSNSRMVIDQFGNVGIGTDNPQGKLDVNGSILQRGGVLHADYVFEPDYQLEPIEEHAEFMWHNKHLKAIPKAKVDEHGREIVEVGAHRKGIVEELEKAHIYIEQLYKRIKALEQSVAKLQGEYNARNKGIGTTERTQLNFQALL